jgi:hypothetical protein
MKPDQTSGLLHLIFRLRFSDFQELAQDTGVDERKYVSGMENRFKRQLLAGIETSLT